MVSGDQKNTIETYVGSLNKARCEFKNIYYFVNVILYLQIFKILYTLIKYQRSLDDGAVVFFALAILSFILRQMRIIIDIIYGIFEELKDIV